jgi:CRP-like cAMP-binding protein
MHVSLERTRVPAVLLRTDAKVELIRGLPLFELCSKRDLRRIAALAEERVLEAGTELIRQGEPGTEFYVVVDGEIEVRRNGRRAASLGAGSFVGEIALLSRSPRTATVVATTPLRVLAIEGKSFVELLDSMPELWLKVARALAERVDADEAAEALSPT